MGIGAVHHVEVEPGHVVVHQLVIEEEFAKERQVLAKELVAEPAHPLDHKLCRHVGVHHGAEGRECLVERAHLPMLGHGAGIGGVLEAEVAHVEGVEPVGGGRGRLAFGACIGAQVQGAGGGKVRAVAVPGVEGVGAERHAPDVARRENAVLHGVADEVESRSSCGARWREVESRSREVAKRSADLLQLVRRGGMWLERCESGRWWVVDGI